MIVLYSSESKVNICDLKPKFPYSGDLNS